MLARGSSSLLPLKIPNFNPAHFDGAGSRKLAEGCGGGEAFWSDNVGANRSIPPTVFLAWSGLPKFMAGNFTGRSCRRRLQALRSEKGGRNRGLGFPFFAEWVFCLYPFSHFFTFYFLRYCYFRGFFFFFFFKTGAKPSPPVHFC